jgi:uncharacterized protein YhaN
VKILRFDLLAFGPFTEVTLDLAAGEHGLHLLYGQNEAGKSSALRALRQLLYGIPERTADAFRHPYDKLRLGARLRHSEGSELAFLRRKARINPLRGPDDRTVIDPHELDRFLGGVDQALFEALFGIDHATLVHAGKEIVQGGGHLGQMLFAAGSGVADLRAVQDGLQSGMEELFVPRGRTPKINATLRELDEAAAALNRVQLSSDEWLRHERQLNEARQRKEEVERQWQELSRERSRLTRLRNALRPIARRKELLAEWETLRSAVLLPEDFAEVRSETATALRLAEDQARQARQTRDQIDEQLERLDVPEALFQMAGRIEELQRRLGEYQKDVKDRPVRELQQRQLEHEAKELLRSLRRPPDLGQAESLRLSVDEPLRIQDLGTQQQGLVARRDAARQTVLDLRGRIERAGEELARLEVLPDPVELRRTLAQVQKDGSLEEQLPALGEELRQAEQQAAGELARFTLWSGSLEALEQLAVPAPESVDRFENDLKDARAERRQLLDRLREEEAALRDLDSQIERLQLEQEVPSEADLEEARRRRDMGWQLVRRAWQGPGPDGLELDEFLKAFGNSPQRTQRSAEDLAAAYEQSLARADQLADRLRREAERVARKAELVARQRQERVQCEQLRSQLAEAEAHLQGIEQDWLLLWQPLGIRPLSPQEMRAWLRKQNELGQKCTALREQREQADRLRERIDAHRSRLAHCLHGLGEPPTADDATLATLLECGRKVIERYDGLQRRRQQLQQDTANWNTELRTTVAPATEAEEELVRWQVHWGKAMARLGLEAEATPAQANAFLAAITELFQKLHEADGFRRRVEGMDRDARHFAADVRTLAERVAPDLAPLPPERACEELHARLTRARAAAQEREGLRQQRKRTEESLRKAEATIQGATSRLVALCAEAGCDHPDQLPAAEQRSAQRRQVEKDLIQIEEQIRSLSGGLTLTAFVAEAEAVDADALAPELERLEEQLEELKQEVSQLDQTIGSERTELAKMNGSAVAAEGAEQIEELQARLQADVQQYAVLRLAAAVLKQGINRHREKNHGPVLERASQLFGALTARSFQGLQIDDEDGEAVLKGVRPGGQETIGVECMSDGSCDQLYLALRLAMLEAYLDTHEPMPFVVDDVLLNFDNARSLAALRALAELSRRTQVLFFTHHEHLLELAREHLPEGVLFTHRLGPDHIHLAE